MAKSQLVIKEYQTTYIKLSSLATEKATILRRTNECYTHSNVYCLSICENINDISSNNKKCIFIQNSIKRKNVNTQFIFFKKSHYIEIKAVAIRRYKILNIYNQPDFSQQVSIVLY